MTSSVALSLKNSFKNWADRTTALTRGRYVPRAKIHCEGETPVCPRRGNYYVQLRIESVVVKSSLRNAAVTCSNSKIVKVPKTMLHQVIESWWIFFYYSVVKNSKAAASCRHNLHNFTTAARPENSSSKTTAQADAKRERFAELSPFSAVGDQVMWKARLLTCLCHHRRCPPAPCLSTFYAH